MHSSLSKPRANRSAVVKILINLAITKYPVLIKSRTALIALQKINAMRMQFKNFGLASTPSKTCGVTGQYDLHRALSAASAP